ncbi:MAG TPA: class I SAM-dependent methyltransferase [Acidimicrobiia bacterium]|nr:class I SAM-dependent methyltransferase [Acidimicrobiia bacterium]
MTSAPNQTARRLFAPIAPTYERWARVLSLGQDDRWRRVMVDGLSLPAGRKVLDVAAGTGSISRRLQRRGHQITAVDLSWEMLGFHPGPDRVQARAEMLPFEGGIFDGLTFGYLLRYVEDPIACLTELARVVKPGGRLGMVEFGLPIGVWKGPWAIYAGAILPAAGRIISPGWYEVGRFLRGSIEDFHSRYPDPAFLWRQAGLLDVEVRRLSLGGGLVMWARKP